MAKKQAKIADDTIQEFQNDNEILSFLEAQLKRLQDNDGNLETITQLEYQIAQLKSGS